jgi:sulfate adenylyltransferase
LGWSKIVGFHTRNVIHRGHEHIQLQGLAASGADGLFVHPVVGKKKSGDFTAEYIAASYEVMSREFYPKNKVILAAWPSYSRYAGPREALSTALLRQNYGCSHFTVGRDHTGVGDFYTPTASHEIFDQFPEIGITPVRFNDVFYSKKLRQHVHAKDARAHKESDKLHISGTQARKILESGKALPAWFMRKEISQLILGALKKGKKVFVD